MQRTEDPSLCQLAARQCAFQSPRGELTRKDVKNEDRPDYVYENKR
jgi:hypothetical protein